MNRFLYFAAILLLASCTLTACVNNEQSSDIIVTSADDIQAPTTNADHHENDQNHQNVDETIVLSFTLPPEHKMSMFFKLVYTEAFSRLNLDFEVETLPPERASELANDGLIDGEVNRIYSYNETYTNLVRVDEPHNFIRFSVFSTNPDLEFNGWTSLENTNYKVVYRHGVQKAEVALPNYVKSENLMLGYSIENNIQRLLNGTADLYIDVENSVEAYIHSESYNNDSEIYKVGVMEETSGHLFLHKKYKDLAPKLAEVLREMKAEGLFDDYVEELGMTQYDILIR